MKKSKKATSSYAMVRVVPGFKITPMGTQEIDVVEMTVYKNGKCATVPIEKDGALRLAQRLINAVNKIEKL